MDKVFDSFVLLAYLILLVAFIDLIIAIARGKTILRKREAFLTPATWICLIGLISMMLPESPFSKGLYTFCMNGGMIVWFVREMFRKKRSYGHFRCCVLGRQNE